jgi:hypothetical protein
MRLGDSQQQYEGRLESIQTGKVQPDTLTVVKKYVNPGRSGLPHVIFSCNRQPKVDLATTVDFFNGVNLGDGIPGYYFPDGYFIPQNHRGDPGTGKWFFLSVGVLVGGGVLALAFASARTRRPSRGDMS